MSTPYLFIMLGFPGSGKSYVSDWLAPYMQAVHLRSDDMRVAMFGEQRLEFHGPEYQVQVHGALQYAARQILLAGHSVVYDSHHNSVRGREAMQRLAHHTDVLPIVVWVDTPLELAKQRVAERAAAGGHSISDLGFVERMAQNLQPPTSMELVIKLDGTTDAAQQKELFAKQLQVLRNEMHSQPANV